MGQEYAAALFSGSVPAAPPSPHLTGSRGTPVGDRIALRWPSFAAGSHTLTEQFCSSARTLWSGPIFFPRPSSAGSQSSPKHTWGLRAALPGQPSPQVDT